MPKIIGLTGGIGSGKSTVARLMKKLGACVIDTDILAHEVYEPGTKAWGEIVNTFGRQVVAQNGQIDRRILGDIVFKNTAALKTLNRITHPAVLERTRTLIDECRARVEPVVLLEVPLLIEAGWEKIVDEVWVVVASKQKILERLKRQRGFDEELISVRMRSRLSDDSLKKHADIIIVNDRSLSHLKKQIEEQWKRLTSIT